MSEREKCRRPCANCPWRKDAPIEYWHPDHFIEIWANCQDDGLAVMACHKASPEQPPAEKPVCQGWVRAMGSNAIGVRIALMRGRVTLAEVQDKAGPELFESFEAMLIANGIAPPQRNRFVQDAAAILRRLNGE